MPPVVNAEEAVLRPRLGVAPHPGDAVPLPALHLHDVRRRMLCPAVARLDVDGTPRLLLRGRIKPGLLQAAGDRKSVVEGKSASGRVDLGRRTILTKKNTT